MRSLVNDGWIRENENCFNAPVHRLPDPLEFERPQPD
jgi:hypothetical protein